MSNRYYLQEMDESDHVVELYENGECVVSRYCETAGMAQSLGEFWLTGAKIGELYARIEELYAR